MKKRILIIGPDNTLNTEIAKLIAHSKKSKVIDASKLREFHKFIFSDCEKNTKSIVLDNLPVKMMEDSFHEFSEGEIIVNKKHFKPFEINPDIIITVTGTIADLPTGSYFTGRFEVIEAIEYAAN